MPLSRSYNTCHIQRIMEFASAVVVNISRCMLIILQAPAKASADVPMDESPEALKERMRALMNQVRL